MTFLDIIYTILIGPLQLIFEIIFSVANRYVQHPGLSIVVLSLVMNFLVLPLYRRADQMQEEARDIEKKLEKGVNHIKKTFSGDERMMILQTYYQQNNYKPTDALNGSVSLLLEIPFFIAAYQFLSHLELLQGVSFGPIADLGSPDGLITIGALSLNILPVIMTLINVISSAIYLKGFPLKTKIQLYAMATFFLVFLYTSPSGLLVYWILNNVFSLVKNIFYKIKNPKKILRLLGALLGVIVLVLAVAGDATLKERVLLIGIGLILQIPMAAKLLEWKVKLAWDKSERETNKKIFLAGILFLAVYIGIWIPTTVISASPLEFVDMNYFYHPIRFVVNSGCMAVGLFVVWFSVFYWIANEKGKSYFDIAVWLLGILTVINHMFFGNNFGNMFWNLKFEHEFDIGFHQEIKSLAVLALVTIVVLISFRYIKKFIATVLLIMVIAATCMAGINLVKMDKEVKIAVAQHEATLGDEPEFNLSKNGKNVIVFMLDRAMSNYIPYILNEKPELKETFDGFTYYANTISYGISTNFTTPALFGGYEYTPLELNRRSEEPLEEKHHEALKLMPSIFLEKGYEVTVCDPPFAGYQWIPDLTVFDDMPEVKTYNTQGRYDENTTGTEIVIENNNRNFFCYALMKSSPLSLWEILYDDGNYNQLGAGDGELYAEQTIISLGVTEGLKNSFMSQYNVLLNLPKMTKITDNSSNTFMMISNSLTHESMMLQEPKYEPALYVDNSAYVEKYDEKYIIDGRKMKMETFSIVKFENI